MGKTTLANDWCEQHKEYQRIQEIAREIMKERSITRADLKSYLESEKKEKFLEFQYLIFEKQNFKETELELKQSFIADRGPDPLVFVEQNMDHDTALKLANSHAAKMCFQRYRSRNCTVVVVCPLDKIEDDYVRLVPTREEQLHYTECLKRFLEELHIPFKYCDKKDRKDRLQWLEEVIFATTA